MAIQAEPAGRPQIPLNRERVLQAAVGVADARGLDALTMRNLAEALGVEAMSLYYHVANKNAILDGVVDVIMIEIEQAVSSADAPSPEDDWKSAMRARILAAREVLLRHPWAPNVFDARISKNPAVLRYFNAVLGLFRRGGFSYDLAHHALHALGSRALGFAQELFQPAGNVASGDDAGDEMLARLAPQLPYLVEMMAEIAHDDPDSTLGWCDDQAEFEFGLDLILDGLEGLRARA
ncbi:MAG: TetR/AcrR family transcriptional regulator C-terminal domain-containing protein [Kibdelosporangium sp.]